MSPDSIYTPISDADTIRVLEIGLLDPGSDQLSGHLTIERLHDQPDYVALSYVWGTLSPDDPSILINNHSLQIRKSFFQAISVLVADNPTDTIRLWIDQICINQGNNAEKERQVQLMSKIYSQARLVVGWLGEEADNSKAALRYLSGVKLWGSPTDELSKYDVMDPICDMVFDRGPLGKACGSLVRRPWFHRLWIVQELALANQLELRCGTSSIASVKFFEAIERLVLLDQTSDPFYEDASKLGQLRAQASTKPYRLNALFGVAFRHDSATAWFKPSYSMSGPDLFTRFAAEHIHTTGGLEILHFAGCGDSAILSRGMEKATVIPAHDIASWVPDWRVRARPLPLLTNTQDNIKVNFLATDSGPDYSLDHVSRTLRVRAIEVDKVKTRGPLHHPFIDRHSSGIVDLWILRWLALAEDYIGSAKAKPMFPLTLAMDTKVDVSGRRRLNWFKPEDVVVYLKDEEQTRLLGHSYVYDPSDWKWDFDGMVEFMPLAEELCRYRALFVTEGGRLGLGGPQVKEGDSIYLIHGLRTPFLVECSS
ncbi:hypothetical protein ACHAPT_007082 [Fusarium lateritium]